MRKLTFHTPTILDEAFIFTMGASIKETSNPIGFFGTGLKYAIAVTLRLGGKIRIKSRNIDYDFVTRPQTVRDKHIIHSIWAVDVNTGEAQRCPMVVDYGKTWEPWMALRELVTNTTDENGEVIEGDTRFAYNPNSFTLIEVECEKIYDAWSMKDLYFISHRRMPIYSHEEVDIYPSRSNGIFYRGIRVCDASCGYTYNIKSKMDLTEDRTINPWYARYHIARAVSECTDAVFLRSWFNDVCDPQFHEHHIDFDYASFERDSVFVREAIASMRTHLERAPASLKDRVFKYLRNEHPEDMYKEVSLSLSQSARLAGCMELLCGAGINVAVHEIIPSYDLGPRIAGQALIDRNTIIINPELTLDREDWEKHTCMTLIEEHNHIVNMASDFTTEFQDGLTGIIYNLIRFGKAHR